ncbi:hypothetical protein VP758_001552 [Vibrio harveyi]|nr:hypothetical protein [Vibrio harveyi]
MKDKEQLVKAGKEVALIISNAVIQASDEIERLVKQYDLDGGEVLINALVRTLLGAARTSDVTVLLQANDKHWLAVGPINGVKQGGRVEDGTRAVMEGIIKLIGISEEFECDCPTCQAKRDEEDSHRNEQVRAEILEEIKNGTIH